MCFGRNKRLETHSETSGRQTPPPKKTNHGEKGTPLQSDRASPHDTPKTNTIATTTTPTTTDNPLKKTQACSPRQTQQLEQPGSNKKRLKKSPAAKTQAAKPKLSVKKPVIAPYTPVSPADVIEVTPQTTDQEKATPTKDKAAKSDSAKKAKKISGELAAATTPCVVPAKAAVEGTKEEKKTQDTHAAPTKRTKTNFQRDDDSENPDLSSFVENDGIDLKPVDRNETRNLDKVVGPKDTDYDTISADGGISDDKSKEEEGILSAERKTNQKASKKNKKGAAFKASGKKKMCDGGKKTQPADLSVQKPAMLGTVDNAANLQKTQALPVDDQPDKPLVFRPSLTVDTHANPEAKTQQLSAPD